MSSLSNPRTIFGFGKSLFVTSLFAGFATFNLLPIDAAARPRADRSAEIVVDADTGNVLYEDNANARRYPASITKVMTLYLLFDAIESGRVGLDDRIVFSRNADRQPRTDLGVRAGDSISVETAILSLALRSANDSATAVAEFLGGTERQFGQMMTAKARELGMHSTNFVNASGLPNSNQYTTAEDLAKLAIAIRRDFPRQFHWFSRQSFEYNGQTITNHNHLVGKVDGVDGLKTGYIGASGFNLAATATRGGRRIVTVVMGGSNRHVRDARVISLVDNAFNSLGVIRMGSSGIVNFNENSDDERDTADAFALGSSNNEYSGSANFNSPNSSMEMASNLNAPRSVSGFSWRTPETSNRLPVTNTITQKTPTNSMANRTSPQSQNFAIRVVNGQSAFPNKEAAPEASAILAEAKTQNKNSELPSFFVNPQETSINANLASIFSVPQPSENTGSAANITLAKNDNNENIEFIEAMRLEAANRESERLKAIEIAEAKEEAARQAQLRQRQQEARRQAEIQRRADERRERQRVLLAEANAREERAKAEKQERDRQLALANQRGNVTIQIGAFKEKSDAQAALASMARHFPSFASKQVTTFSQSGSTWFRARVSGLGISAAETACRAVTRSGGRCSIISR